MPKHDNTNDCAFKERIEKMDEKIDKVHEDVSYMRGKIDGMNKQKNNDVTFYGMLSAIGLGLWNLIK